ncbi:Uncharacterized protein APZ42_011655 [Daphnia magna]|uniref:Uncharacterized protein n=1 Tax=Daphnia magna TaxID=35525 RepID=A0A0P5V0X1_9CRUS|nr:Uncharacterized protein APZ42_011655 [Daphnia magna]
MKSFVLVLIIVAAVYAVDNPPKRHGECDTDRSMKELLEEIGVLEEEIGVLEEEMQQEGDEVDSDKIVREASDAVLAPLAHRSKRNSVEKKEKARLVEIDALVEKLWADKEKQANGEAAIDAPITEQKEEHDTEPEVKTPRKKVSHPRFENTSTSEYTHDRRKLERSKHGRKDGKKDNRKTATAVQDELNSDEDPIDAEKPADTKPAIEKAGERKHHRIENHKKKITKHHKKEESDEDPDSATSVPEDSPTVKPRKVSAPVEPATVESEPITDAPEESFISDSVPPSPAADSATVASEDLALFVSENLAPVPTEDSATVTPADPTTIASTGVSDDVAHEEITDSLSQAINIGQARLKRHDTVVESKIDKRTEKQKQRKPTTVSDRSVASTESDVPRKEKSNIEHKNKTSEEDRVSRKHGSPTKKAHLDEKEGKEKKTKPQKKDEQPEHTVGRHIPVKAAQNGGANNRTNVRVTVKQTPAPKSDDMGKVGSEEVIHAKIHQAKHKSNNFATASPKNVKSGAKNASAARARDGVPNKEKTPAVREEQASDSTAKPLA